MPKVIITIPKDYFQKNKKLALERANEDQEEEYKNTEYKFDLEMKDDECYIEDDGTLCLNLIGLGSCDVTVTIGCHLSPKTMVHFAEQIKEQHKTLSEAVEILEARA